MLLDKLLVLDRLLELWLGGAQGASGARRGRVQVSNVMGQRSDILLLHRSGSGRKHWRIVDLLLMGIMELWGLFDDVLLVLGH